LEIFCEYKNIPGTLSFGHVHPDNNRGLYGFTSDNDWRSFKLTSLFNDGQQRFIVSTPILMKYLIAIFLFFPLIAIAGEGREYFPKGTFESCDTDSGEITLYSIDKSVRTYNCDDDLQNEYYTNLFMDMQEPSLLERAKSKQQGESYRFLKVPTFHDMVCIRIDIDDSGKATLYKK